MEINPCCVCGEEVKGKAIFSKYKDKVYYLCCLECKEEFEKEPAKYALQQHVM